MRKLSKKHKTRNHKTRNRKTRKQKTRKHIISSATPLNIRKVSNKIEKQHNQQLLFPKKREMNSYSPTINQELVTLKSIPKQKLHDCNIQQSYNLKEPLQIGISGYVYGKSCYNYNTKEAKDFLLRNLSANKHVNPKIIVPPIQMLGNCWFNAMFVTFFISDKGRKFFHFLRQLMILGKQYNGNVIPENIRNAFALLNFGIDACLSGNQFAYELNTNSIIHQLYKSIPKSYKEKYPYIVDIKEASNPIFYYMSIINYLSGSPILLLFLQNVRSNWKNNVTEKLKKMRHLPHIIVLEIYDDYASEFTNKPISFSINIGNQEGKYKIDSATIRDTNKHHFCATITCESNEMGYDGMSFHRIVPLEWKHKMNTDYDWQFEGSTNQHGQLLTWNFTKCYQLLMYYRV